MTLEKFQTDVETLEKFFTLYCREKHQQRYEYSHKLTYKNEEIQKTLYLCKECHELISYSFERLMECPHEIKPRCRNCPNPCYEKKQWKALAKLMRYSGIRLGVLKVKNFFKLN